MSAPPRGFKPIAILALVWNLFGLMAVIADMSRTAADIAKLPAAQQAMYAARPGWSIIASLVGVVGGSLGCVLLLVKSRWSVALFGASLAGVVLQDVSIFAISGGGSDPVAIVLQGIVLLIAVALLLYARRGQAQGWLA